MRSMRRVARWAVLLIGIVAARPAMVAAQSKTAIDLVPADAWGFAYVHSLSGLNDNATLMQNEIMGMAMMDLLALAQGQFGIEKGLDTKGSAAMVMFNMKEVEEDAKGPPVGLIIPVTDAKDFISNFSPDEEKDGITKITFQDHDLFARGVGKHVILTPTTALSKKFGDGKDMIKISDERRKLMTERSVSATVALGRVVEAYKGEIKGFSQMAMASMGPDAAGMGKQMDESVKTMQQIEWLDLGLGMDKNGFALAVTGTPKSGTELEKKMKAMKAPSEPLLAGLPGGTYLAAIGMMSGAGSASEQTSKQLTDLLLNNPSFKENVDPEKFKAFAKDLEEFSALGGRMAASINALEGSDGLLGLHMVAQVEDSEKYMSLLGKLMGKIKDLPKNEDGKKAVAAIMYSEDAESIGSIKVAQLKVDLTKTDAAMSDEDMGKMKKVLGDDGFMVRMGAVDAKRVVMTLGGGKSNFERVAADAKKGTSGIAKDAGIKRAVDKLPGDRMFELFISAENAMNTINKVSKALGEDPPFGKVPSMETPVTATWAMAGSAGRFDLVVPMQVIKGMKDAAGGGGRRAARVKAAPEDEEGDDDADEDEDDAKPAKTEKKSDKKPDKDKDDSDDDDDGGHR